MRKVKVKVLSRPRKLLGHIIRHHEFITNIFEGKVISYRGRERPIKSNSKHLMDYRAYSNMKRAASGNTTVATTMCSNL